MPQSVRILKTEPVTHNVRHYRIERPADYTFTPGQATEVSLDKDGWRDEKRPFTFTALPMRMSSNSPSRAISIMTG